MRRVHEGYLSPDSIRETVQALGIRGIIPIGALAWQTYPVAATPPVILPGTVAGVDGVPQAFLAPNLLTAPYIATHLNYAFKFNAGNRVQRWKLQDSNGVTKRVYRSQNPAKNTGAVPFGTSEVIALPPIPMPSSLGVRAVLAADDPTPIGEVGAKAFLTALLVQPRYNPNVLAVAPTATGAVLPTTAAGTALTSSATGWSFGAYAQMTAGLTPSVLVTAVIVSSTSGEAGQVGFATGAAASEVDWGVFGWAEAYGSVTTSARYDLMPYPLLIPASTRIAARARGTGSADSFWAGLEYIPLPIR